jgi:hypothetical protein
MKCNTPGCYKKARKGRKLCCSCKNVLWRKNNRLLYLFLTRKGNAKRRGKEWSLTFDEFVEFCKESGYDKNCGIHADDASIDRIHNWEGYHKDNIRSIKVSENSKKKDSILEVDLEWLPKNRTSSILKYFIKYYFKLKI